MSTPTLAELVAKIDPRFRIVPTTETHECEACGEPAVEFISNGTPELETGYQSGGWYCADHTPWQ